MPSIARKERQLEADEALALALATGTVIRCDGPALAARVGAGGEELQARRAASCLVEPAPGDRVLVARSATEAWVLAILVRSSEARARVRLEGDLELELPRGRLAVVAGRGVDLLAGGETSLAAPAVRLRAGEASAVLGKLSLVGSLLAAQLDKVKVVGGLVDSVLERVTQTVKRSYRFVEELDQLFAESVHVKAEKNLHLHGRNSLVTAAELVKLEGEQIHLG